MGIPDRLPASQGSESDGSIREFIRQDQFQTSGLAVNNDDQTSQAFANILWMGMAEIVDI